ncbi:MAG TPA: CBS domain-containing protein [Gemmatimonadota bacterium]|nr:CBS domain-containing protein [Gemmatimonadota bacterium]
MSRLRDIMVREVVTMGAETSLREAIGIMRAENVTGAPVLQESRVVGVVSVADILDFEVETPHVPAERPSQVESGGLEEEPPEEEAESFYSDLWDDVGAEGAERFARDVGPEWDLLSEHVVSEVMTQTVFALPQDTELAAAAQYMMRHGIHRVLVMEGSRLLGIASSSDFVRAIAERRV